jgi:hypothetical protein
MNPDAFLSTALTGILTLLAVEALVLVMRRPLPFERLCSVVAGGCLLAAWRAHLAGATLAISATVLALAGICHALPWFMRASGDVVPRVRKPRA